MAKHVNPNQQFKAASAPYNFVPLPDQVVALPDALPQHDRYEEDRLSGYLDVEFETRAPLFVRAAIRRDLFDQMSGGAEHPSHIPGNQRTVRTKIKNNPAFFNHNKKDEEIVPVAPGSSLRGMIRSAFEIVTYSSIADRVTNKKMFFRSVSTDAMGNAYRARMTEERGEVQEGNHPTAPCYGMKQKAGFLRITNDGRGNKRYAIEVCEMARIEMQDIENVTGEGLYELRRGGQNTYFNFNKVKNPNAIPRRSYQHKPIWVDAQPHARPHFFGANRRHKFDFYLHFKKASNPQFTPNPAKREGVLVLTGPMRNKHMAFVFFEQASSATAPRVIPIHGDSEDINERLADLFEDDDQLSRWQKSAFARNGRLKDGEPLFFLEENGELVFFGRACMFRLPYLNTPRALAGAQQQVDFANGVFGFVRPGSTDEPGEYAGRVHVCDAHICSDEGPDLWLDEPDKLGLIPPVLSSPKPTSFQHYLTQNRTLDSNPKRQHQPYDDEEEVQIRGFKRYWPKGNPSISDLTRQRGELEDERRDKQHTYMRPVKAGVRFGFRIYFDNLSELELGALQWTLRVNGDPKQQYVHQLGMGKPYGLGAIVVDTVETTLINRPARYKKLFEGTSWHTGEEKPKADYAATFESHMLTVLGQRGSLRDVDRISMLLKMMEWSETDFDEEQHYWPNKHYMPLDDFRGRPVLPDPLTLESLRDDVGAELCRVLSYDWDNRRGEVKVLNTGERIQFNKKIVRGLSPHELQRRPDVLCWIGLGKRGLEIKRMAPKK